MNARSALLPNFVRLLDAPITATVLGMRTLSHPVDHARRRHEALTFSTIPPVSRPVLTLLLLSFLTFVLGLGRQAITDSDEAFYAEAAREMVESGDWLSPRFNYENRWEKPVLYYWLTAATYLVTGTTEFAARLWSGLSGIGLVLL